MSSCKVYQLGLGLGMEESSHGCTAARTWHLAEVLYLSISQTASRNKERGKDKPRMVLPSPVGRITILSLF